MAKAIKFSLMVDGYPAKSMDDIRENFNISDLLAAVENGALLRWLKSRSLDDEAAAVEALSKETDIMARAKALVRVVDASISDAEVEEAVWPLKLQAKEKETQPSASGTKVQKDEVISAYHEGYSALCRELEEKSGDYSFVKAAIAQIFADYKGLYLLDKNAFYARYITAHPLVILAMLANQDMRPIMAKGTEEVFGELLLKSKPTDEEIKAFYEKWMNNKNQPFVRHSYTPSEKNSTVEAGKDILMLYNRGDRTYDGKVVTMQKLCKTIWSIFIYVNVEDIPVNRVEIPHIKAIAESTSGHFSCIERDASKKYMIISIEPGNFVMPCNGGKEDELDAAKVNGHFPIINGIEYSGKNDSDQLVYMEV